MKKFNTLLMLFFVLKGLGAQNSFKTQWDSLYRNISVQGSLGTGVFWNLGMTDPAIEKFQGQPDAEEADFETWMTLFGNLKESVVDRQNIRLPEEDQIIADVREYLNNEVLAFPVLYARGGKIEKNAYSNNAVQYDVSANAWNCSDPDQCFELQRVFISAPIVKTLFRPEIRFLFSNNLLFGNTVSRMLSMEIFRGDDQIGVFQEGEPFPVHLDAGDNRFRFRVHMSDGEVFEFQGILAYDDRDLSGGISDKFKHLNPFKVGDEHGNIYAEPQRQTELQQRLGAFVDYLPGSAGGVQNPCIRKPVIIVEGIDFGFKNAATGCYGGKCGAVGLIDLQNGFLLNPYAKKAKDREEKWKAIEKAPELLRELRSRGYDIFYLDFHNGAEYIENNAMLLVKLIQDINARKCSDEEIVIFGASMGGLVSRYALTHMEKQKLPHCVRLYISFDVPNSGANIPLGMQAMQHYLMSKLGLMKEVFKRKIDRAASRQMLFYHILSKYRSRPHDDRNEFVYRLEQQGNYPKLCRNVAVTNGSLSGAFQNFNPGDELLAINPYIGEELPWIVKTIGSVYALAAIAADEWIVMYFKMALQSDYKYAIDDNTRFLDHFPGSIRYDLKDARLLAGVLNVVNKHSSACFIPTYSALDFSDDSSFNTQEFLDPENPDPRIIPFSAFTGAGHTNEEHMTLTDENIAWMIRQIEMNRNDMPRVLRGRYNLGRKERAGIGSVTVENGGILKINAHEVTGTGSGQFDKILPAGSHFEGTTTNCSPTILIDEGGELSVGDRNLPASNTARFTLGSGSVLILKPGSTLRVHNGSSLVVGEGSKLILHPGVKILLEGSEALLQIDGTIRLEERASLSFNKGSAAAGGYIKFRNAKGGYGSGVMEIGGKGTSIDLEGDGKHDVVLQVEGRFVTHFPGQVMKLSRLNIVHGKVMYGNRSALITSAPVSMLDVEFKRMYWVAMGSSDALILENSPKAEIESCLFTGFASGIHLKGSQATNKLSILKSKFADCVNGLIAKDAEITARHAEFKNCEGYGIFLQDPENDIIMESNRFVRNKTGLMISNKLSYPAHIFMNDCDLLSNNTGMETDRCVTTISCSRFFANGTGLSDIYGELNLSTDKQITGVMQTGSGGNNTFAYNSTTGIKVKATVLYLDKGANNFIQEKNTKECRFITGELAYSTLTHHSSTPYAFYAGGNHWSPAPDQSLENSARYLYFVTFPYPYSSGTTLNLLSGSYLNSLNTACYSEPCNPCDRIVADDTATENASGPVKYEDIQIYPYPVSGEMHVVMPQAKEVSYSLELTTVEGKVLLSAAGSDKLMKMDVSGLATGLYLLRISVGSELLVRTVLIGN